MGMGIVVCGLNGAGKSTLGRALAARLRFHYIDAEDLFFPKTDPGYLYASPRPRQEAESLLLQEARAHEDFVLAAVKGDYGEAFLPFVRCALWVRAPRAVRLGRVRDRSFQKFGERVLPGGDLYARERGFWEFCEAREEDLVEGWLRGLRCPVLQVDGTRPVEENLECILGSLPPW